MHGQIIASYNLRLMHNMKRFNTSCATTIFAEWFVIPKKMKIRTYEYNTLEDVAWASFIFPLH